MPSWPRALMQGSTDPLLPVHHGWNTDPYSSEQTEAAEIHDGAPAGTSDFSEGPQPAVVFRLCVAMGALVCGWLLVLNQEHWREEHGHLLMPVRSCMCN